jgi:hypothetical protein
VRGTPVISQTFPFERTGAHPQVSRIPVAEGVVAVITEAEASRTCTLELEALPARIQQVRRIVAAKLRYWRLDVLIDQSLLGISELLANVHRHVEPDKRCKAELTFASGWLTISVSDSDPRLPRVRDFEPMGTCGRGLAMVVAMSDSWGAEALIGGGKAVWFTLRAEAQAPPRALTEPVYVAVRQADRRPEVTLV